MSNQTDGPDGSGGEQDGPPDMEALAKRYMELWGKQVSSMAADPSFAEAMSKTMNFMTQAANSAGMPPGGPPGMASRGGSPNDGGAPGSPAAGPAPGPSGADLDGMAERIDTLDRRVALLEAALGGILAQSGKSRSE